MIQFPHGLYNGTIMTKKPRKKKPARQTQPRKSAQKGDKYSAGEIAMAILGGALLIMVAGIIITSLLN